MPIHTFFLELLETPTGLLLVVTDSEGRLRAVDWQDHEPRMRRLFRQRYGKDAIDLHPAARTSAATQALRAYFEGDVGALIGLPTATNGTAFQRLVWQALCRIPPGTTTTYGALATRLGRPTAARAVGHANGANPIAIVVPCHRLIGTDNSLTGFGGGIDRKRWLLAHEGVRH